MVETRTNHLANKHAKFHYFMGLPKMKKHAHFLHDHTYSASFTDLYGDDSAKEHKSTDNGSHYAICLLVLYVGHPNTEGNSANETEIFSKIMV